MAVISNKDKAVFRRAVTKGESVDFKKAVLNNSMQALEDYFASKKAEIGALLPPVGSVMKKRMIAYYFDYKFNEEK